MKNTLARTSIRIKDSDGAIGQRKQHRKTHSSAGRSYSVTVAA